MARTAALAAAFVMLAVVPACASARDVVVPARGHERGTIVFIHGGGWGFGNPGMELADAQAFAARGWRGVSLDYPLMDFPAAFAYAARDARRLSRHGEPVVAIGESAGGTIAAWLAARHLVDAAVSVDGPADLDGWDAVEPTGALWWIPVYVRGFSANRARLSPSHVYRHGRSAPLMTVIARQDHYVGEDQGVAMERLGALVVHVPGGHCASLRWRRPAAAFLLRATRP